MSDHLYPILLATRGVVAGLGFTLGDVAIPVLLRKFQARREASDPSVMITIAKSKTPEKVARWTFSEKRIDFLIDLTILSPYEGPEAGLPEYTVWRDTLVDLFSKPPLTGADEVFELTAAPADFLSPPGQKIEWDVQKVEVTASIVTAN